MSVAQPVRSSYLLLIGLQVHPPLPHHQNSSAVPDARARIDNSTDARYSGLPSRTIH